MSLDKIKAVIDKNITSNDNQEITGAVLNNTLNTIVDELGSSSLPKSDYVLDEDNELYKVFPNTAQVVPVRHPDLSTQPSILPFRWGYREVCEKLIPADNNDDIIEIAYSSTQVSELFNNRESVVIDLDTRNIITISSKEDEYPYAYLADYEYDNITRQFCPVFMSEDNTIKFMFSSVWVCNTRTGDLYCLYGTTSYDGEINMLEHLRKKGYIGPTASVIKLKPFINLYLEVNNQRISKLVKIDKYDGRLLLEKDVFPTNTIISGKSMNDVLTVLASIDELVNGSPIGCQAINLTNKQTAPVECHVDSDKRLCIDTSLLFNPEYYLVRYVGKSDSYYYYNDAEGKQKSDVPEGYKEFKFSSYRRNTDGCLLSYEDGFKPWGGRLPQHLVIADSIYGDTGIFPLTFYPKEVETSDSPRILFRDGTDGKIRSDDGMFFDVLPNSFGASIMAYGNGVGNTASEDSRAYNRDNGFFGHLILDAAKYYEISAGSFVQSIFIPKYILPEAVYRPLPIGVNLSYAGYEYGFYGESGIDISHYDNKYTLLSIGGDYTRIGRTAYNLGYFYPVSSKGEGSFMVIFNLQPGVGGVDNMMDILNSYPDPIQKESYIVENAFNITILSIHLSVNVTNTVNLALSVNYVIQDLDDMAYMLIRWGGLRFFIQSNNIPETIN